MPDQSAEAAPERPAWQWKPGQSGNPRGRPPGTIARDLARRYTEEAILTLVAAMRSPRERVPAAIALLDRGWGKPKETVEGAHLHMLLGGTDSPPIPETIEQWLERRQRQLDAQLTITAKAEEGGQ